MHMQADENQSLWREVVDGKAKPLMLVVLTIILAIALTGCVLTGSFLLVAMFPWMGRYSGGTGYVRVSEEVLGWLTVFAAMGFIAATAWMWTRSKQKFHRVFYGVAASLVVVIVTIALCVGAATVFRGDEEFVVGGIVFLGIAALLVVWLQFWRAAARIRPWHNAADGKLDLRCPSCGYRMIGLSEARCPECGTVYTVDELLAQQAFAPRTPQESPESPPPLPAYKA